MQRSVALVFKVGILNVGGIVADNALDKWEVVQEDGAAEAARDVNPSVHLGLGL